jgi:hypothetical protein
MNPFKFFCEFHHLHPNRHLGFGMLKPLWLSSRVRPPGCFRMWWCVCLIFNLRHTIMLSVTFRDGCKEGYNKTEIHGHITVSFGEGEGSKVLCVVSWSTPGIVTIWCFWEFVNFKWGGFGRAQYFNLAIVAGKCARCHNQYFFLWIRQHIHWIQNALASFAELQTIIGSILLLTSVRKSMPKQSEWPAQKWVLNEWLPFEGTRSSSHLRIFCDLRCNCNYGHVVSTTILCLLSKCNHCTLQTFKILTDQIQLLLS